MSIECLRAHARFPPKRRLVVSLFVMLLALISTTPAAHADTSLLRTQRRTPTQRQPHAPMTPASSPRARRRPDGRARVVLALVTAIAHSQPRRSTSSWSRVR